MTKLLIAKKCAAIRRKVSKHKNKAIAERCFFHTIAKYQRFSKILKNCPTIGETIETFVQKRNVGAGIWKPTGVLTSDGNTSLKQKATYESIK